VGFNASHSMGLI
jgi:hypothetical protein